MAGKSNISNIVAEQMAQSWRNGVSFNQIGKQHGTTGPSVRSALERIGVLGRNTVLRPTYSLQIKAEAIRLYTAEKISAKAVALRLGLKSFTVKEWVSTAGVIRDMSQAATLSISKGRLRGRSTNHYLWHSSKTGEWCMAHSSFEVARMAQLDRDCSVTHWSTCKESISYQGADGKRRRYLPDLVIHYVDGSIAIEEIKPDGLVDAPLNLAKFAVALDHYRSAGAIFRVVTEKQIGAKDIEFFRRNGPSPMARAESASRQKEKHKAAAARRLAAETPDQRKERLSRQAKAKRERRRDPAMAEVERRNKAASIARSKARMSPAELAEKASERSQKAKQRRANETPEQRRERNRKVTERAKQRRAEKKISPP